MVGTSAGGSQLDDNKSSQDILEINLEEGGDIPQSEVSSDDNDTYEVSEGNIEVSSIILLKQIPKIQPRFQNIFQSQYYQI